MSNWNFNSDCLQRRSFGQERPPLTDLLKNILLRYPDGGQILKEIIQNADDAGATEVRFFFDATSYGTSSLVSPGLGCFQGPALYCYNNAVFTEEDWDGLQRLMRSNKKDNPLKVGRFGIGFNSVYHITDLPSIVSGETVAFLDPHEKYFVRGEPGQAFSMHEPLLAENFDQFEPFHKIFDCNLNQGNYFQGTLFRFPLRTEPSKLSSKLYTKAMVQSLFESFKNEASIILHFLKSVDCISLHEREKPRGEVSHLYTIKVSDETKTEVRNKRKELTANITSDWNFAAKSVFYTLEIEEQRQRKATQKKKWFIANQVGTENEDLIELGRELKLLPWVGVSFPMDTKDLATYRGRIFCFLPLPPDADCRTGLPVQVNGYFGLTDNRRALKWPGPDCLNDDTARWNQLLMREVGSRVYESLVKKLILNGPVTPELASHPQLVYSAFPQIGDVKHDWHCLLESFCRNILTEAVFYTAACNKGRWITLGEAIVDRMDDAHGTSKEVRQVVLSTLLKAGQPVVTLPRHVLEMVDVYSRKYGGKTIRNVTPRLLRQVLRSIDLRNSSVQDKLLLLEYVLQDTPEESADLNGVPLLPLENGEFCKFQQFGCSSSSVKKIFIASEKHKVGLLPNAKHLLLRDDLPLRLKQKVIQLVGITHASCFPTQLFNLSKNDVTQLLWQTLPADWSINQQTVAWCPGKKCHPSVAWLQMLWEWVAAQYPYDLPKFESMPLIPVSFDSHGTRLAKLCRNSTVILAKHSIFPECLPSTVQQFLTASGCVVVQQLPDYLKHNQILEYVAPPTPDGLLKVLLVARENVHRQLRAASHDVKFQLRSMLSKLTNMSADQLSFLRTLPIFQAVDGKSFIGCHVNNEKLPVASQNFSLPEGIQILDKTKIISSSEEESFRLLKTLGMRIETTASLLMPRLQQYLTSSAYGEQEKNKLMLWILERMEILGAETPNFTDFLRQLAFVATASGRRKTPRELFDHSDELLKRLLIDYPDAFPATEFSEPMKKRKSGLQVRCRSNLTAEDLLKIIRVNSSSPRNALMRGNALLELINQRSELLDGNGSLIDGLRKVAWLPRVLCRPDSYPEFVPWYGGKSVCEPKDMCPSSTALLVGASVPLFDENILTRKIQDSLGISRNVKFSKVVEQLQLAIVSWNSQPHQPSGMPLAKFQNLLKKIYNTFSNRPTNDVQQFVREARLSEWIWHGNGFTSPDKIALLARFPKSINLHPHLFLLPKDFHGLKEFLFAFGVKEEFTDDDLLSVLRSIKAKHDNAKQNSQDVIQDLDLCRAVLEWLISDGKLLSEHSRSHLLVPVDTPTPGQLRLELCNECTYCDREFLRQGGSESNFAINSHLIHKAISDHLASSLDVPRLSSCLAGAQPLGYVIEDAGQYEPITTRIRNILQQYKEGVAIFKEIIQNADDAGASKVCFVVDWRESPRKKLLSDELAKCQGPALWAYNNAMFSKKDFENINKLAGETKKEELDKVGRFGLGFNAVYHFTDVPSFISGENFVMFDPNMYHIAKVLGRAGGSRPGMKINLATFKHVLSLFPDQFLPYNDLFGCNTTTAEPGTFSFEGTLFRFPFRTDEQAKRSEISKDPYTREHMRAVLDSLKESASTLLLFAQNVKKVRVFEIPRDSHPKNALGEPIISISKEVETLLHSNRADRDGKGTFIRNCSSWFSNEQNIMDELEEAEGPRRTELLKISVSVKESMVSNTVEAPKHQDTWLVNSCYGSGASLREAESENGRKHSLLPITGAAVKILHSKHVDEFTHESKVLPVTGEVFCFMPLSIASGLPVHVNGYFSVYSNRRRLWEEGVGERQAFKPFEARWNEALMEDALAQVYLQLLELIKSHAGKQYVFHSLWPNPTAISNAKAWKPFVSSFFNKIIDEQWALFYCNKEWRALNDCLILDAKLSKVSECLSIMNIIGKNVLSLPEVLLEAFRSCGKAAVIAQYTLTEKRFLREFFFPNVARLPNELRDSVLGHVLDQRLRKHRDYDDLLKRYPCFSCSKDGKVLRKPSELVHPGGKVACLFSEEEKRFPTEKRFLTKERAMMLEDLGMIVNRLSWDGVCERAEWISSRYNTERQRANHLVHYLNQSSSDSDSEPTMEKKKRLAAARFLPFLKKPQEYSFPWKASDLSPNQLVSANDLYPEHSKLLVGASQLILDESSQGFGALNKTLKNILGLNSKQPQLSDVLIQLDHVVKYSLSLASNSTEKTEASCSTMYVFFQKIATLDKHKSKRPYLRSELESRPWMLVKGQMITPKRVAVKWEKADGSPYLYSLPFIYTTRYHALIKWYGVKERFTGEDFLEGIWKLREDTDGKMLSNQQLDVFLAFLEEVCATTGVDLTNLKKPLPLPRNDGVLHDAGELAMNDAPWMEIDGSIQYVHEKIPKLIAYKCGAKELRSAVLSNCSMPIGQPFGQSELLTDRLNGILKSYPPDEGVLKELVQNADDAKAKEIHFVFDPRTHGSQRIFSNEWNELQGPAICVYNDQAFSEEDIQGIQNLGIGSKVNDAEKTGQYGIGFNAVYHLTDCPSFLSDDNVLCVSDPHHYYVPGATVEKPGRLFNQLDKTFRTNFQEVLIGFLGEFFTLRGGTMFRFPLRQDGELQSKISKKSWRESEIRELLSMFQHSAKEMLLFLNNVTKISISEIENGKLKTYSVQCTVSDEGKRSDFLEKIKQYKSTPTHEIPWHVIHYTMNISDTNKVKQDWLVSQSLGCNECSDDSIPDGSRMGLLPRAGIAACLPSSDPSYVPLRYRAFCFLPLPVTTNLRVHVNGHFALDSARRDLWHDPKNADARMLWNEFVKRKVVAAAYASLISEARGVIRGLRHDSDRKGHFTSEKDAEIGLSWYHDLFPDIKRVDEKWNAVVEALYMDCLPNFSILPVAQSVPERKKGLSIAGFLSPGPQENTPVRVDWYNVSEVYFCPDDKWDSWSLEKSLLDVGIPLLSHTPEKIHASFGEKAKEVHPEAVTEFLRAHSPLVDQLPKSVKDTSLLNRDNVHALIKYCSEGKDFFENLDGVPLLLTKDEVLRCFSVDASVFCSRFSELVPSNPELFLHEKIRTLFVSDVKKRSNIVNEFDILHLSKFKNALFPSTWSDTTTHQPWDPSAKSGSVPSKEWLELLWDFIHDVSNKKKESDILQSISTWPIIPTSQNCLVPVSISKTVLNVSSFLNTDSMVDLNRRRLLVKLGCSKLQKIRITSRSSSFVDTSTGSEAVLKHYLALVQSVKDVLGLLDFTLDNNRSQGETKLNDQEIENLLMFLQSDVSSLSGTVLLKLPFYQTIAGEYTRLSTCGTVYEVPSDLPLQDLQVLADVANCVFLRQAPKLRDLYDHIGIQQASSVHFYLRIVLKYFNSLTPVGRECHLKYIRDNLLPILRSKQLEYNPLISALKVLPFIPDHSGALHRACDFYDPKNKVFSAFVPKEKFPQKPFDSEDWEGFLHEVGLQSVVTEKHFLEYATRIQGEVCKPHESTRDKEISEMSQVLVSYLFANTNLHDDQFLSQISKIKFVPAAKIRNDYLQIHPAHMVQTESSGSKFIMFHGSVTVEHATLVWSSAPLLSISHLGASFGVNAERQNLVKNLGIHTKPPHELVVSHAKNISGRFHQTKAKQVPPNLRFTLRIVMEKLYDYFKKCCRKGPNESNCSLECTTACDALRDVPVVLVDEHTLVRGNQLSFHSVSKTIEPYMFEVPRHLSQYEHFLKCLGAQEYTTPLQYATVLQAIKDSCEDKKMHPGERGTASAAVIGLFLSLNRASRHSQDRDIKPFDQAQSLVNVTVLYLPTQDDFLKRSTELLVNDTMEQKDRLKEHWNNLLVDFTVKDQDPPDKLVELLPAHLKVQKLSEKVSEELNPNCIDKVCVLEEDSNGGRCEYIQRYRVIMCSSEFSHALVRLFKFQENASKVPVDVQKDLKAMETRLTITCMQAIQTRLVSIPSGESVPGSEKEVDCFCQDDRKGFRIMIKHGEGERNEGILHNRLSSFIHKITGRRIDEGKWRFLMMILGVKNPSEISRLLDEARIPRSVSNTGKEPCPGETIPKHFHFLLKNDIDYYLRDGELVAYELKEEDENNDAVYVYAKIIEQTNEGEGKYGFNSRYKIDVGQEEPIEVSKLKLYKFDRDGTKVNKKKEASSTELVLYEGAEAESDTTTEEEKKPAPKPCTLEEAKKEVAEALKELWNLPESERSSAIRRLIRRWHPDKNLDCETLATEVTKFLLDEVDRLKAGGVPGYTAPGSRHPDTQPNSGSRPRSTWDGPDFSDFFRSYQRRARRERERYHDWRRQSQGNAHETEPGNKDEAERWMRQAREDLKAAGYLFQSQETTFYAFTCFHCQQAVEKCLKALLFAKGRIEKSDLDTHDVMSFAYRASREDESLRCLPQLVSDIQAYYAKTRYPECSRYFPSQRIPSEMFTEQNADDALSKTREILQLIENVL